MNKNYDELTEVIVTSQEELNNIPVNYKGRIYIQGNCSVVITNKYYFSPTLRGNATATLHENATATLRGNATATLHENATATLWGNATATLWENATATLWENATATLRENATATLWENATATLHENATATLHENATATLRGNATATLRENATATLHENATADATGNSQVVDRTINGRITLSGNARIVYMPKNIHEFMDFYGIKHDKKKAIFYKAVGKDSKGYYSSYDNLFRYNIGEVIKNDCDTDIDEGCSYGLHIAHLDWALRFGSDFGNLAILEVETDIDKIVMPKNTDGKVRTSEIKVLREVPLEECGIYGKILAKRMKNS